MVIIMQNQQKLQNYRVIAFFRWCLLGLFIVSNAKKVKTRKSHSSCTTYFYNCSNNSKVQCGLECKNYSSIKPVLFMLLVVQQTQSKCVLKRWKIRCTRFACNLLCFCKLHGYLYENSGFFITRKTWFTRRLFAFGSQ